MDTKHSDVAKICDLVYTNPDYKDTNSGYDTDYKFLQASAHKDSAEGFFGVAFEKDDTIIIAFRGTNPINSNNDESILKKIKQTSRDFEDDLSFITNQWGLSKNPMPQYKEALEFAQSIHEKYGSDKEIIITGHSLGGGLAQLVSIKLDTRVIVFESPGVLPIARNLFSQDKIDEHKSLITSYVGAPNSINTFGVHIVDPIQIQVKTSGYNLAKDNAFDNMGTKLNSYMYKFIGLEGYTYEQFNEFRKYTLEQHDSEYIVGAFNPKTGKPYSIVNYNKWPNVKEAYEQFNSKCIYPSNPEDFADEQNINILIDDAKFPNVAPTILPTFWSSNDNRPTNKRDDNKPSSGGSSSSNEDGGKGFFPTSPTDKPTSGPNSSGGAGFNFWSTPDRDYQDNPFGYMKDFAPKKLFEESSFGENTPKTNLIYEPGWLYSDKYKKDNQEYDNYLHAKMKLSNLVKDCLQNPFCKDDSRSLISKALGSSGLTGIFTLSSVDVQQAASGTGFTFLRDYKSMNPFYNTWTQPLRKEVGAAISHVSPLVLDLDGDGVELFPYTNGVYFDIDNDGFAEKVGWTKLDDGQLARDLNGNGRIDDITELFGDDLISAFFKLSLLDTNDDKVIDKKDPYFAELLVWQDKNSNGYSEKEELQSLTEIGIKSISLSDTPVKKTIEGNIISSISSFSYEDGRTYEVADVHYHNDDMDTWYKEKAKPKAKIQEEHLDAFRAELFQAVEKEIKSQLRESKNKKFDKTNFLENIIKDFVTKYTDQLKKNGIQHLIDMQLEISNVSQAKTQEFGNLLSEEYVKLQDSLDNYFSEQKKIVSTNVVNQYTKELHRKKQAIFQKYQNQYNQDATKFKQYVEKITKLDNDIKNFIQEKVEWLQKINQEIKDQYNDNTEARDKMKLKENEVNKLIEEYKAHKKREADELVIPIMPNFEEYERKGYQEISKLSMEMYDLADNEILELKNKLDKEHNSKLVEEKYKLKQESKQTHCNLLKFFTDYEDKSFEYNHIYVNKLTDSIRYEANYIYKFILNKIGNIDSEDNVQEIIGISQFLSERNNILPKLDEEQDESMKIDPEVLFLPMLKGYGKIPTLHLAMSQNPQLKAEVMDFMIMKPVNLAELQDKVLNILYTWSGLSHISPDAKAEASNIELRKLMFIERITGQQFKQLGMAKFVGQHASTSIQKAYDIALIRAIKNLLVQGPFTSIFSKASYSFEKDDIFFNASVDEILESAAAFANIYELRYDFWVQIGYILASNALELNTSLENLRNKLSHFAGEPILIDFDIFSLIGDDQDNYIKGTSGSDYIKGMDGNDYLDGKEGSDYIEGGEGDDTIFGAQGIDRLFGGNGNDAIYGGEDRDFIYGGAGSDIIKGEGGDDNIEGGEGADDLDGGDGQNTLSYGDSQGGVRLNLATGEASGFDAEGDKFKNFKHLGGSEFDDYLIGDDQDNEINGEGGNDEIYGGKGNDQLFGATGDDRLYGEEGNDHFTGFEGEDYIDGGDGEDTVSYHHPYSTVGVIVDLVEGKGVGGFAHDDTYVSIENVEGSRLDDRIYGNKENNKLYGYEGDDFIEGREGNDIIVDLKGANQLHAGDGNDVVVSGLGNICSGGNGIDTLSYEHVEQGIIIKLSEGIAVGKNKAEKDNFAEFENAIGTQFDDTIIGDDQDNQLIGLSGNDTIEAKAGNDFIDPGEGDDKVYAGYGNDRIMGSEGKDFYDGGEGIDFVDYSSEPEFPLHLDLSRGMIKGAIFAQGDKFKNIEGFVGTKFNDLMIGSKANDWLYGFDGDDEIRGGDGFDILSGGKGINKLYGEEGSDTFIIHEGSNFVYGGSGINTVDYRFSSSRVEVNLSEKQGKKSTGEIDIFEDVHDCIGSAHDDIIVGNYESNKLYGLDGDDYIDGGSGNEEIDGGNGNNSLFGGNGDDKFYLIEGNNSVDGGNGKNKVFYSNLKHLLLDEYYRILLSESYIRQQTNLLTEYSGQDFSGVSLPQIKGVVVDLAIGIAEKPGDLKDQLTNIQDVEGTRYDDIITGSDHDNNIGGVDGNDIIYGGKGNDIISSGRGYSELHGGEGDDIFKIIDDEFGLIPSTASIFGGEGIDTVNLVNFQSAVKVNMEEGSISYSSKEDCKFEGVENFRATSLNDIVHDSKIDNSIETLEGDDIIYLTDGNDFADSGEGNDIFYLSGSGNKQILGGSGYDKFVIMPGFISNSSTATVIGDFYVSQDRIDLSHLGEVISFDDLKLDQGKMNGDLVITKVHIQVDKEIILLGIEKNQVIADCFVFYE